LPGPAELRQVFPVLRGVACVPCLLMCLLVGTAGCTGVRSTPATRYLGILLNARDLGASEVMRAAAHDPTIKAYVAQHGNPDFVLQASLLDTQLIYVWRSVLAYFHRDKPGAPSAVSEVTPLPSGLFLMLPSDVRAGTGVPLTPGANCWTAPIASGSCRTCCLSRTACTVNCTSH
jgi:hypothetical protein